MNYIIKEVNSNYLTDYCKVPITFQGNSIFKVATPQNAFAGFILKEVTVNSFFKDYDLGGSPLEWKKFDLTNWRFYIVYDENKPIAAATLVMKSEEIRMLEGKDDLACLWDIRVHPDYRGKGIGRAMFQKVANDAKDNGCVYLKIETQNNNVSANRFYSSQGCKLTQVHTKAYYNEPEYKDEVMMIWFLNLNN